MRIRGLVKEYMLNSTLHGAKFIADDDNSPAERIFWLICVVASWIASGMLISASLGNAHFNQINAYSIELSTRKINENQAINFLAFTSIYHFLGFPILSDAFRNNAISFVVESSYRDWKTNFPAIVVCESKNMDRIQEIAEE